MSERDSIAGLTGSNPDIPPLNTTARCTKTSETGLVAVDEPGFWVTAATAARMSARFKIG